MRSAASEFANTYSAMSEPQLMQLARGYDSLTGPAQDALRAEFARRKMQPPLVDEQPEVPELRNLVTIRQYRDLSEAIVARSLLEANGLEVFLRDENLVRLDWQVSNFIGGIRLQVEAHDAAKAQELLNLPVPPSIPVGENEEFLQPHCPACGSAEITFEGASRKVSLPSLFLFSLPLPDGPETWVCGSCGARWVDSET